MVLPISLPKGKTMPKSTSFKLFPFLFRLFLFGVVLIALLVGLLAAGGLWLYDSDRILPGVHTLNLDLGGKTISEAKNVLENQWNSQTIVLENDDQPLNVAPSAIGIVIDAQVTAQIAYQQGRSLSDLLLDIQTALSAAGFAPAWHFDPAIAEAKLLATADLLNQPAVDASLQFVDGQFVPTAGRPGQALDVATTLAYLQQHASQVALSGRLPLTMITTQPAFNDASPLAAQANALLTNSLTVHVFDPIRNQSSDGVVPAGTWGSWLVVDTAGGQLQWQIDPDQVNKYMTAQAVTFGSDRYLDQEESAAAIIQALTAQTFYANLRLYHTPSQHLVQSGETLSSIAYHYGLPYPWLQQANPGLGDILSVGQSLTIPSPDDLLPLPVVETKRIVVSISQQRVWVYENGGVKWEWAASTGIDSSPTSPGIFQIQSHELEAYAGNWDLYMPYFMGVYRPVPTVNFMNGFHGFPTRNGSTLLWTGDLGHPVTYGCILLSTANAETLFNWVEEGVVVEIQR